MQTVYELYPILVIGAIIGVVSIVFIVAYLFMKDKKSALGFDRNMKDSEIFLRIVSYAKPHAKSLLVVVFLLMLSIAYSVISPYLTGTIYALFEAEAGFELSELISKVIIYISILIVSLISTYFQAIILQRVGQQILSKLREDTFSHIEKLSHSQLHSTHVGTLVTRVTSDTNSISSMATGVLIDLFKNLFKIVGILAAMLVLNYMLTLMVLCFVPFTVLFTIIFRKFSRRAYRRVRDDRSDLNAFLSENLSGIKVTQLFGKEDRKMGEFIEKNDALGKSKGHQIFVFGIFRPLIYMLYVSCILCLFYLGGRGYLDNITFLGQTVSSAVIVSFYMYINEFFNPIQSLADQFNHLQAAFASAEKIFTLLDTEPEVQDSEDAIELDTVRGEIEFRNVWFAYKEGEWVLRDVSFKVEAGQTVAFVGSTGSGKTTILSLLCRNYDIQQGQILVDGIDIRKIRISSLRRHFGQMLQDVFLFSGTIRSNIVLREDRFTDEEIHEACHYVNADSFIDKLPKGLDEEVRERGNNFSVGQRQLLSFVRTVIHKPAIMILDEATANIDTETEILIQDSLEKMMNIGTMLIVAHRLSTIQHSDKIIVLSHGQIIEEGNHAELLAARGKYYGLYMLQFEKERISEGL